MLSCVLCFKWAFVMVMDLFWPFLIPLNARPFLYCGDGEFHYHPPTTPPCPRPPYFSRHHALSLQKDLPQWSQHVRLHTAHPIPFSSYCARSSVISWWPYLQWERHYLSRTTNVYLCRALPRYAAHACQPGLFVCVCACMCEGTVI